jgi:hypothetical protein
MTRRCRGRRSKAALPGAIALTLIATLAVSRDAPQPPPGRPAFDPARADLCASRHAAAPARPISDATRR